MAVLVAPNDLRLILVHNGVSGAESGTSQGWTSRESIVSLWLVFTVNNPLIRFLAWLLTLDHSSPSKDTLPCWMRLTIFSVGHVGEWNGACPLNRVYYIKLKCIILCLLLINHNYVLLVITTALDENWKYFFIMELKYKFLAATDCYSLLLASLHITRLHCENACIVTLESTQQILDQYLWWKL